MERSSGRPALAVLSYVEDSALDAILALRRLWAAKAQQADDDAPSGVTLADLGFDARLRNETLLLRCARHGRFLAEWSGPIVDTPPDTVSCPASENGVRCGLSASVLVLERAARAA